MYLQFHLFSPSHAVSFLCHWTLLFLLFVFSFSIFFPLLALPSSFPFPCSQSCLFVITHIYHSSLILYKLIPPFLLLCRFTLPYSLPLSCSQFCLFVIIHIYPSFPLFPLFIHSSPFPSLRRGQPHKPTSGRSSRGHPCLAWPPSCLFYGSCWLPGCCSSCCPARGRYCPRLMPPAAHENNNRSFEIKKKML